MTHFQHRGRTGVALGTAGLALAGSAILATPAAAHTPSWNVDCSTVSLDLTRYDSGVTNTVAVKAGGKDLLAEEKFGSEFHKKLTLPAHDKPLRVRLIVEAGDGEQYSRDETKTAPVCETESPEPTPTTSETPSESPSPTDSPAPSQTPSSSAPASEPAGGGSSTPTDLAETGSSSSTPLVAGIGAAVVAAGAAVLMVTRKRRSARG